MSAPVTQLDKAEYMAVQESMLKSTVGIGIDRNTVIGTGTCVSYRGKRFILTANHVIKGAEETSIRFFVPPSTPLIEHSMRDGFPPFKGGPILMGDYFETGIPFVDEVHDVAALPLISDVLFPNYMRFVDIEKVVPEITNGASVLFVGFPVDNSINYAPNTNLLGLTSEHANYDVALQTEAQVHSSFDSKSHFLMNYTRLTDGIEPFGFSGAGAWCNFNPSTSIWEPNPGFVGVVAQWHRTQNLIQITRGEVCRDLFLNN